MSQERIDWPTLYLVWASYLKGKTTDMMLGSIKLQCIAAVIFLIFLNIFLTRADLPARQVDPLSSVYQRLITVVGCSWKWHLDILPVHLVTFTGVKCLKFGLDFGLSHIWVTIDWCPYQIWYSSAKHLSGPSGWRGPIKKLFLLPSCEQLLM